MTIGNSCEFAFRVLIHPDDPPELTVIVEEEPKLDPRHCTLEEWARLHLDDEEWYERFELDLDKHYRIEGKGRITGSYSYEGEYDEDFDVLEVSIAEVRT